MPNRILREGILDSELINALSPQAELFYRRLQSKVDDYGRFQAHPSILRAACYPLQLDRVTEDDISAWLDECAHGRAGPLITTYEVKGKKYLEINKFGQRTRTESKFPAPPPTTAREVVTIVRTMLATGEHLAEDCGSRAQPDARARSESESYAESETDAAFGSPKRKPPRYEDTASEQDVATREASERMYGLHPKKKNLPLVVPALADAVARAPDWRTAIADIEACHAAWCAHSEWLGNNGKFVPKLPEWIADQGYTQWPPGHARNQPARKLNIYNPPTMPTEEPDDPRTSPVQH